MLRATSHLQLDQTFAEYISKALFQALSYEGATFFEQVEADCEYFDANDLVEDAQGLHCRLSRHVEAVTEGHGLETLQDSLAGARAEFRGERRSGSFDPFELSRLSADTGVALRHAAQALYRLISGLAQPAYALDDVLETQPESEEPSQRRRDRARHFHLQTSQGAFCWLDDCESCLGLTKAAEGTAVALSKVGDLYQASVSQSICAK